MPDLTIVIMQQCEGLDHYQVAEVGGYYQTRLFTDEPTCSCKAWQFGKRVRGRKFPCKHINEAEKITPQPCSWHEQWGISQEVKGMCPECGGKTIPVRVGV